jgi:xylulokinase
LTIRWFQKNHPNLWKQVKKILLPKDYLRWRLTGQFCTDPSDASGTLLMDIRKREWSDNLLNTLLIERDMLPPIFESNSIAGELLATAAEALGLIPGTPVVTGAADTACSMLGAGVSHPDSLLLTLSTAGQLILPAMDVQPDLLGRIHTFCSALRPGDDQAGWYKMGGILSAGLSLRWLRDNVFRLTAADAYERMTSWAEDIPAGANGLLFLPYLIGERTPHMDPNARGIFIGLSLNHGQADLVRAVMEGVSLACKEAFKVLAATGDIPSRIIMAGGCAQSNLWQQIIADVFGMPVQCLEITEQSALGAAFLAGSAIGKLTLTEAAAKWVTYGCRLEPDMANHHLYIDALAIFRDTYRKHKDDFPQLIP